MIAQIFLIRHGETEWSLTGRHTSRTDVPLTEEGEQGATRLRELLRGITFTHVLTSPLQRAQRTCVLTGFGAVARPNPNLQEWDYGDYEGRTTKDIRAEQPEWNLFHDGCPQGESTEEVSRRADHVLAALKELEGNVALFSHGHFLRALAMRWIGLPAEQGQHFALGPASLSMLGYEHPDDGIPALCIWNACPPAE